MKQFRADVVVLAACLALAPLAVAAQEMAVPPSKPELTQEIVPIEHADPESLDEVLRVFAVEVQGYRDQGVITIKGAPQDVALAAAAARRLDVPPHRIPGVEIVAHVLGASRDAGPTGEVPKALAEVAEQLREVFGYQSVRLLDSVALRVRDGEAGEVRGSISTGPGGSTIPYRFGFNRLAIVDGGEAREVRLDGLVFESQKPVTEPGRTGADPIRLVTSLDVREGQKAVVGKAASGGAGSEGLILVVAARVID